MSKHVLTNAAMLATAAGAAFVAIYSNTNWLVKEHKGERERCYNVVRTAQNDCATVKHACAYQAKRDKDPEEFIMVPKGLCKRLVDGKSD